MQLRAYLESLTALGGLHGKKINIITPTREGYESLIDQTQDFNWIFESDNGGGFDLTLREFVKTLDDNDQILFGCDDVVFTRPFTLSFIPQFFESEKNVIGFSLRLGLNIQPDIPCQSLGIMVYWTWPGMPSHWGYPFELMASVYRVPLVKEILENVKTQIQSPNFLESAGVTYVMQNKSRVQPYMAMFRSSSYAVAQDVNRVQHQFQNKYNGDSSQDPEYLKTLYKEGKTLEWGELFGIEPPDCFVGNRYWKVL